MHYLFIFFPVPVPNHTPRYCAEVTEPTEQFTTNWPEGTDERRFVISSPHRAFYILAENAEERK